MEENKKIKNIKLTLYITLILCLMVGVSYATYNLVLKGNKQHQINIGSLTLTYEETNNINVTGDTLKTDEEGIASGNVFNFKVSVNNTTNKEINYIVYLTMDVEYLNNIDKGKVYLNNKTKNIVYGPSFITDLAKYKYENSYVLCTNTFTNATETHEYSLTSWISPKTNIFEAGGTHQTIIGGTVKFKVSVETVEITNLDTSGANKPVLASNMIPVYYDEANSVWKKADKNNSQKDYRWYSYSSTGEYKGMWANAVTVKDTNRQTYLSATPGTTISMDDITTMWVWIPRFNAVTPSNYNGGTQSKPNAIDVTFVKQNETAIDAFTFGNKELSGFWYGKFEIGGSLASSCTNETCNVSNIVVKPNVSSLRSQKVSSFFYASRSMEQAGNSFGFVNSEVDTHMSKNNEWGAVAYLTQSIYGRCTSSTTCTEIGINNNSSYITGYGAPAGSSSSVTNGTYNTALGKDASTTGTIYGIYDMSGGAYEYVMGVYNNAKSSSGYYTGRSGGNVGGSTPINGTYTDQTSKTQYNTYGFYTYDDYLLNYNTNTKGNKVQGKGTGASTTGTIYGIYDMSGGANEYVMGVLADTSGNPRSGYVSSNNSGFTGMLSDGTTYTGIAFPDSKYYNLYTGTSYTGHALTETKNWYSDVANFFNTSYPWLLRGGSYNYRTAGVFSFGSDNGNSYGDYSSHLVISNK